MVSGTVRWCRRVRLQQGRQGNAKPIWADCVGVWFLLGDVMVEEGGENRQRFSPNKNRLEQPVTGTRCKKPSTLEKISD